MNDQAANRLLKTLEEPPPFAHLILLAEHREEVLPTVASRCQARALRPLAAEAIARAPARRPSARSSRARRRRARGWRWATRAGARCSPARRAGAARRRRRAIVRAALDGETGERRWSDVAGGRQGAGAGAGGRSRRAVGEELELLPSKERSETSGKARTPGARVRAPSAHAGAGRDCGWPSCGCATSVCVRRARRSWCYAVDRHGGAGGRTRRAPAPAAARAASSWCARRACARR